MTAPLIDTATVQATANAAKAFVDNLAASLRETNTIVLNIPSIEGTKADWFEDGGQREFGYQPPRPFMLVPNVPVRLQIDESGRINWTAMLTPVGLSAGRTMAFALHAGGTVRGAFTPLSGAYRERKLRKGQPGIPGVATGAMANAFENCVVTVRRD